MTGLKLWCTVICAILFAFAIDTTYGQQRSEDHESWLSLTPIIIAQARPTESVLRQAIGDLQRGEPNYDRMESAVQTAVRQQLSAVTAKLKGLGQLRSLQFVGQQQGADMYEARFQNGSTTWFIALSPDGKISTLVFH
jgi:hypothetical protein